MDLPDALQLTATITLVIINAIYIYITKRTLDATVRQSNLAYNPVIGIAIEPSAISAVFGPSRRQASIGLKLTNVGNAPAIEVVVDAEIILQYSNIQGEKVIPTRHEPGVKPFIRPGEEISDPSIFANFGNICVKHILDDFRERDRLNDLRIKSDPSKDPYKPPMLRACVYYQNNIGQYFESTYETYLVLDKIPKDDETAELHQIFIPKPKFHACPMSKEKMNQEISDRNKKRRLCGW